MTIPTKTRCSHGRSIESRRDNPCPPGLSGCAIPLSDLDQRLKDFLAGLDFNQSLRAASYLLGILMTLVDRDQLDEALDRTADLLRYDGTSS